MPLADVKLLLSHAVLPSPVLARLLALAVAPPAPGLAQGSARAGLQQCTAAEFVVACRLVFANYTHPNHIM